MRSKTKEKLTVDEVRIGLRYLIKDGLAAQIMLTLTSGVFLVAFALNLGASNFVIGLLAAIPPLTQLIQIPSIYLVERIRERRKISVISYSLSRFFLIFLILIPLVFSHRMTLYTIVITILFNSVFNAVGGCSLNSWIHDFVPRRRLGTFFSKRLSLSWGISIPIGLAAGFFLDQWKQAYPDHALEGYSILFSGGLLMAVLSVYYLSRIPEPRMSDVESGRSLRDIILQPFRYPNFRHLILFLGSWNFAVNLAAPFFTVYMLKRLQLSLSIVVALTLFSQLISAAFFRVWGRFADRYSQKTILRISGPLFLICILAWTFTTMPEKHLFTVPLLIGIHLFSGISTAGVTLASGNIGLKTAPKGQATSYLAGLSIVNSLAAGFAPILGGKLIDFFSSRELSMSLQWSGPSEKWIIPTLNLRQWDFLFFMAFFLGLYSLHRLAVVKEEGEVKEKIAIREMIWEIARPMRVLSSVGGLRQLIQFPFSILRQSLFFKIKPKRENNGKDE